MVKNSFVIGALVLWLIVVFSMAVKADTTSEVKVTDSITIVTSETEPEDEYSLPKETTVTCVTLNEYTTVCN